MTCFVLWDWPKIKKLNKLIIVVWSCCWKILLCGYTASWFPYVILCPNLMTVQFSKGKVPHTRKELLRIIIKFEYEKLLLLKSPQNKVASKIKMTEKKKRNKSDITYIPASFWDKVINFTKI